MQLVWLLPKRYDPALLAVLNEFLQASVEQGVPTELASRYLSLPNRLSRFDALSVHRKIANVLPQFEYAFKSAARKGGIDWHLLAAISYQESRWNNDAVSPTGVRGIMQMTLETADFLDVTDRMDMQQTIVAAARYLQFLNSRLPKSIDEPERTWFAVAAYNMGLRHVLAGYRKARELGRDPTRWQNIADLLPTLYGREFSQGEQAKHYVERVQIFTDILRFHDSHLRNINQYDSLYRNTEPSETPN